MEKYIEYVNKFQENEYGLFFIDNQLKKYLETNIENQNEIELILDFIYSEKKIYKSIWYKTILEKEKAWNKKLQLQASKKDNEVEWVDYEVKKDFWDWFKFVKLLSKECYQREWKLMSHCVSSYYGRKVAIYSLRDKNNLPHATIEENNQVKGKWNQTVDNKYFWYCIEFLEEMWFSIWENEMKNIWYYKLDSIDKDLTCSKLWKWYISDKDLDKIKDKNWKQYNWFWLLNVKKLVEIKLDFSLKWNFDINILLNYFNKNVKDKVNIANKSFSTAVANEHSSTAVANKSSSTAVANKSFSTAVANESSSTAVANASSSTAIANEGNSIALTRWKNSKAIGKLWAWLVIAENDDHNTIIDIQCRQVDWKIIKEDTLYICKWWEFIEFKK